MTDESSVIAFFVIAGIAPSTSPRTGSVRAVLFRTGVCSGGAGKLFQHLHCMPPGCFLVEPLFVNRTVRVVSSQNCNLCSLTSETIHIEEPRTPTVGGVAFGQQFNFLSTRRTWERAASDSEYPFEAPPAPVVKRWAVAIRIAPTRRNCIVDYLERSEPVRCYLSPVVQPPRPIYARW